MSEWKEYRLGELLGAKGYIRGPFGSSLKRTEMQEQGYPVYEQQHAIYDTRNFRYYVNDEKFNELIRFKTVPNDLIVSCSGTVGEISIINSNDPVGIISQALLTLRPNINLVTPLFLYYFFKTSYGYNQLLSASHGSVQVNIAKRETVESIVLKVPDLITQNQITEILSSLDDKIELNNAINKNLEALAQALFKRWFVDFEFPFDFAQGKPNEEGQPYKSSGGGMVESELGMIPKEWRVAKLDGLLTVKYGKDHKHLEDGKYPVYGSGGIMRYAAQSLYNRVSILIPRKGTLNNIFFLEKPFWTVDTMFYTEIINELYAKYLYYQIKSIDFASMNVGSAVPSMTTKVLNNLLILQPDEKTIIMFDSVMKPIFNLKSGSLSESNNLECIRDLLLPKLISGELEVNEALAQTETL